MFFSLTCSCVLLDHVLCRSKSYRTVVHGSSRSTLCQSLSEDVNEGQWKHDSGFASGPTASVLTLSGL